MLSSRQESSATDGSSATLAPNVGLDSQCVWTVPPDYRPLTVQLQWPSVVVDIRSATAPVAMSKDVVSPGAIGDWPRSAPMSCITAMSDRVNALWDAFHARRWVAEPILSMTYKDLDVEKSV